MFLSILASIVTIFVVSGIIYRRTSGRYDGKEKLDGQTIIVTGASAGIGLASARDLARRGARVIMACRNLTKAQRLADEIEADTGNDQVSVEELDLSDLDSVRSFAERIKRKESSLKVLINNAGGGFKAKHLTKQNLELTMASNHYGHFLLTNLLLDLLKASAPSRIINVSSMLHESAKKLDVKDLNFKNKEEYSHIPAYSQTKLCNILFTKELSHKLKGTGVTANSLHPGIVYTEGYFKTGSSISCALGYLVKVVGKDAVTGAQTTIYLAVSDEVKDVSGKYFVDCKEAKCHPQANDQELAKMLWEASEKDVQLQESERFY